MNNIYDVIDSGSIHNTLYTDFKAEVVALNLLKYYTEVDHVFLKRLGNNDRSFKKDITTINGQTYDLDELIVSISSFREGMYDSLPEGIFHSPSLGNYKSRIDEIIFEIQKQKKIEESARNFFQPFELECFFLELQGLSKESEFDITDSSDLFLQMMTNLWPLLKALDNESAKIFIYILPFFHSVIGSKEWFEKFLMAFLRIPVYIHFVPHRVSDSEVLSNTVTLSNFHLGISMVLTGEHLDGERNWAIQYGPIPYSDIKEYLPNSNLRKLLQILYDYCLPATVDVVEQFVTERNDQSFLLGKELDNNRLGFTTFL